MNDLDVSEIDGVSVIAVFVLPLLLGSGMLGPLTRDAQGAQARDQHTTRTKKNKKNKKNKNNNN